MARVDVINLRETVRELLAEYGLEVQEKIDPLCEKAARDAMKKIRADSKNRTGVYAKDWAVKPEKFSRIGMVWIVYNKKHYQLAHLLENDHDFVTRRGGERIKLGEWEGDSVIYEAEQQAQDWLYDACIRELG